MLVLIHARVTDSNEIHFKGNPVIAAKSQNSDWITMELDSYTDYQMSILAGRLMDQSAKTVVLLEVDSESATATPFAPLLEKIAKNPHHYLIRRGVKHNLVERLTAQIPTAQIQLNLSDDATLEFIDALA
jgi:hypothetical protein